MTLSFDNKEIRSICEDQYLAEKKYGIETSRKLQNRLADLLSLSVVSDIFVGNPTEIELCNESCYCVDLDKKNYILFKSNHVTTPIKDGKIDWSMVSRIKILELKER